MRKIAVFTGSDLRNFGGGEKDMMNLSNSLSKNFDVTLFSLKETSKVRIDDSEVREILDKRVKVVYYNAIVLKSTFDMIPLGSGIKAIFQLKHFDSIYCTSASVSMNLMVLFVSKLYHKKLFIGIHTPGTLRDQPIEPTLLRRTFIWPYNVIRNYVLRHVDGIRIQNKTDKLRLDKIAPRTKVYDIPPYLFDTIKLKQSDFNSKEFIVLSAQRLSIKQKGLDLQVKIIKEVLSKNDAIKFHIAGSGDDGEALVSELAKGHPKNVSVKGFLSEKALDDEYRKSNLFISTSRGENFGLNIGEAQGYGLPSIAFAVMGSEDIIVDDIQGKLITPYETGRFAAAILNYYKLWKSNKSEYKKSKSAISEIANSKYRKDIVIAEMAKMLVEKA